MLKVLSGKQMKLVDQKCSKELNIPDVILIENAGKAVYEEIVNYIEQYDINTPNTLIICGKGNNGGDGFVAARHLINDGINTTVICLFDENEIQGNAKLNLDILSNSTEILYSNDMSEDDFIFYIKNADVVVDAILGTGINSELKGEIKKTIEFINQFAEGMVLSIDIPSGLSADTAKILGTAVAADCTVCFETPKIGNILPPAMELNGDVIVAGIGIPSELIYQNEEHNINLLTEDYISEILPIRISDSNKGDFGKVFNIVGSKNLSGAGYLASKSVLKVGAGYSIICCADTLVSTYSAMLPDFIYKPYNDENKGYISDKNLKNVLLEAEKADVILLGCGLGTNAETVAFVKSFLEKIKDFKIPVIIDADGLNCISMLENIILPENTVLTPHPMELSRLLKMPKDEITENRIETALVAAEKFNATIISKGLRTIIADKEGNIYINSSGNNALAKAGTGDVLAGMVAGFAAQTQDVLPASQLAVFLHGLAGDIYAETNNEYSLTASELIDYIPDAINNVVVK